MISDSPPPSLVTPHVVTSKPMNPAGSSSITMLQTQFAGTSISDNYSIVAAPSCDTVSDSDEDSEDEFAFPRASEVISVDDVESIVPGEEPRAGKGPGRGKFSPGNVINPKRNEKQDQNNNVWTKVPKTTTRTFSKIVEEKDVCPDHGTLCSRGICTIMQRKKREQEQEMKRAERAAQRRLKNKSRLGGDSEGLKSGKKDPSGDDDDDDAKTEVGDDTRSVVTCSSRASASVASESRNSLANTDTNTRSRGPPTGSVTSSIRGDWGPRRSTFSLFHWRDFTAYLKITERNARHRQQNHSPSEPRTFDATYNSDIPDDSSSVSDRLETIAVSSARPTYGGEGSTIALNAKSVISYDDDDDDDYDDVISVTGLSTYGSTPRPPVTSHSFGSTMKPTLTHTSIAPVSVSSRLSYAPSDASAAGAVSVRSNKSRNFKSVKSDKSTIDVKAQGKTNAVPEVLQQQPRPRWESDVKGKGKERLNMNGGPSKILQDDGRKKTWDEMVEEDGSELGPVMEF